MFPGYLYDLEMSKIIGISIEDFKKYYKDRNAEAIGENTKNEAHIITWVSIDNSKYLILYLFNKFEDYVNATFDKKEDMENAKIFMKSCWKSNLNPYEVREKMRKLLKEKGII